MQLNGDRLIDRELELVGLVGVIYISSCLFVCSQDVCLQT